MVVVLACLGIVIVIVIVVRFCIVGRGVIAVRCRGLWAGLDVDPALMTGWELCEALMRRGVLTKDTHGSTIRLAPPLVATEDDIAFLVDALRGVLADLAA